MRHSERAMQSSIEAANNHATSLQHRLAQMVVESSRSYQLLFGTQQCLEGIKAEKFILLRKLSEMEDQSKKTLLIKKQVSIYYISVRYIPLAHVFTTIVTIAFFVLFLGN